MTERPILFSGAMVRAILEGRKTQTRRVLKPQPVPNPHHPGKHWVSNRSVQAMVDVEDFLQGPDTSVAGCFCPYGAPGDRLWVRETHAVQPGIVQYAANNDTALEMMRSIPTRWEHRPVRGLPFDPPKKWTPSIHMPRWACRIVLEITDVRVERLQDISEADVIAEGFVNRDFELGSGYGLPNWSRGVQADLAFKALWEDINGAGAWAENPWVWAITFKRVMP